MSHDPQHAESRPNPIICYLHDLCTSTRMAYAELWVCVCECV